MEHRHLEHGRSRRRSALVAGLILLCASCGTGPGEELRADGEAVAGSGMEQAPATAATDTPPTEQESGSGVSLQRPLEGISVEPPSGFEASERPSDNTIILDDNGEPLIAVRHFFNGELSSRLTVTVHAPNRDEFEAFLANFAAHEGSVVEVKPVGEFDRMFQLEPRVPDSTNPPQLVGELADGTHVYVISELGWEAKVDVILSVRDSPGAMESVTVGQLTPSGIGADSDERDK
ncbi:MAG: hypothetical protein GY722_29335 [bacterium]|nr:hypothetical protein [bacterium]